MKIITLLIFSSLLFQPMFAQADGGFAFPDLDTFIKNAKQIFIAECVPIDETNLNAFVYVRNMRVINTLQGTYNPSNEIIVLAPESRPSPIVGHYYLICGSENADGELASFVFDGEAVVEIQVWGEAKSQKQYQLSEFIKKLDGKTVKEKLLIIYKRRQDDLRKQQENMSREIEGIDKIINSTDNTNISH